MSRGLGRVERGALHVLARRPQTSQNIAMYAGASWESTRRALRSLRRKGLVCYLGQCTGGRDVWCLPEHEEEARARLIPDDLWPDIVRVFGLRAARKLARSYVGSV